MRYSVFRLRRGAVFGSFMLLLLCVVMIATGIPRNFVQTSRRGEKKLPVYSVETNEKKIALGINCAWGDEDIPVLLEILERYGVRASFFVTGEFARKFPGAIQAIDEAGHEIGSHSNTHVDLTRLGREAITEQIREGNRAITGITGKAVLLFRTPSGAYNNLVIETIENEGMIPIQWDADSIDYRDPTPAEMHRRIMDKLRPGSITLFHAGAKNTPGVLPQIIGAVRAEGYEFAVVGELIHPPPYRLDHEGRQWKS
ncbi:MAG: polysaccharide deacetylase family protein [Oscillospiraceae bacterium]|nr:polysaccharide deacetylase family protein [Oscillospiraceae bacterium]